MFNAFLGAVATPSHPYPGMTCNGFAELTRIDSLMQPEKSHREMNILLAQSPLFHQRGPLPRTAFPAEPVPEMVNWFKQKEAEAVAQAEAKAKAEAESAELRASEEERRAADDYAAATARMANQARQIKLNQMATRMADDSTRFMMESAARMGEIGTGYKTVYY